MRLRILVAAALILGAASAVQSQTKDQLDRRDKLLGYEAVGLLESSRGHCTGALITRDVVLTAAHCMYGKGTAFKFKTGYSHGSAIATRAADDIVIAPGYIQAVTKGDRAGETANDVALVRLVSPIFEPGANPYQIAKSPRTGTKLTLVSYGRGRMNALTLERGCKLHTLYRDGIVGMDCSATFGSSGAPVFIQSGEQRRIFSIVSSGYEDETFGVELSEIVPELMQVLRDKRSLAPVSTAARRISVGDRSQSKTGGSIRFIRPD